MKNSVGTLTGHSSLVIITAVIATVAALSFYDFPVIDSDLWWHMAYGRSVVEDHSLHVDHSAFAWTPDDNEFVYVSWLGDLILWGVHELGGPRALSGLQLFLYLAVAVLFYRLATRGHPERRLASVFVILLAFLAVRSSAAILKNTTFSLVYYAAMFAVLARVRHDRRILWFLPPLFVAWVNTHGEVVVAMAILGIYGASEAALAIWRRDAALPRETLRLFALVFPLCLLAILATPEGWHLPRYLFDTMVLGKDSIGVTVIMDAKPHYDRLFKFQWVELPWTATVWIWLALNLSMFAHLVVLVRRREWQAVPLTLVGLICATLSWAMARLVIQGGMAWLFTTGLWFAQRTSDGRPAIRNAIVAASSVIALVGVAGRVLFHPDVIGGVDRLTSEQPVAAARFVEEHDLPGPIFNDYQSGGYLLWEFHGKKQVFIDPRYRPFTPEFRGAYFKFESQPSIEELETTTLNASLRTAVVRHRNWQGRICLYFQAAPSWNLVFIGPNAAVYVHNDAMTPELKIAARKALVAESFADVTSAAVLAGISQAIMGESPGEVLKLYRLAERNVPDYKLLKKRLRRVFTEYCIKCAFSHGQDLGRSLTRDEVRQRFVKYYLDGNCDIARLVATGYLATYPDDAEMHYNLACAEAGAGDLDTGEEALVRALQLGFDRLDLILGEPDLAPLRRREAVAHLIDSIAAATGQAASRTAPAPSG